MTSFTESRAGLPDDPLHAGSSAPDNATDPHPEPPPSIAAGFEVRVQYASIDAGAGRADRSQSECRRGREFPRRRAQRRRRR